MPSLHPQHATSHHAGRQTHLHRLGGELNNYLLPRMLRVRRSNHAPRHSEGEGCVTHLSRQASPITSGQAYVHPPASTPRTRGSQNATEQQETRRVEMHDWQLLEYARKARSPSPRGPGNARPGPRSHRAHACPIQCLVKWPSRLRGSRSRRAGRVAPQPRPAHAVRRSRLGSEPSSAISSPPYCVRHNCKTLRQLGHARGLIPADDSVRHHGPR